MSIIIKPLKCGKTVMKYISDSSVQKSRFNRYLRVNQNDTNLACDKFFRQDELYDRKVDVHRSGYRMYSIDDIPVDDVCFSYNSDIVHYRAAQKPYIESNYSGSMIRLHKTNTLFELEKIYDSRLQLSFYRDIQEKFAQGFSPEEVLNVYYSGIISHVPRESIMTPAFKFLKVGYPIEYVVRMMEKSKLRKANGEQKYCKGTLEFLMQFPYMRSFVISCDESGEEMFDSVGAKIYPKIYDKSKNEIQALQIFKLCKFKSKGGFVKTFEPLADFAVKLLDRNHNHGLSFADFELLKNISRKPKAISLNLEIVNSSLDKGGDVKSILKHLFNDKSVK